MCCLVDRLLTRTAQKHEHAAARAGATASSKSELAIHEERDHIDEAILVLSCLAAGAPGRARPLQWLTVPNCSSPKGRSRSPGRKGMSTAARKAIPNS